MKKFRNLTIILAAALLLTEPDVWSKDITGPSRILVLNSYNQGFPWTDGIVSSIRGYFESRGIPADLHIEYMDTKRYLSQEYFTRLYNIYRFKYTPESFDCIISTDDDALNFLVNYGDSIFGKTPVVFAGINRLDVPDTVDRNRFTGIMEEDSPEETIRLIKQLHPGLKKIYVICDHTTTGMARYDSLKGIIPLFKDVEFIFSPDLPVDDVLSEVEKQGNETPVLLMAFFKDSLGRGFTYHDFAEKLKSHVRGPVYTVAVNYMGQGVIGGVLNSPERQGTEAAAMALRILRGESTADIPVVRKVRNRALIDYPVALRNGVDVNLIPDGTEIINKPRGFYDFMIQHWHYLLFIALAFLIVTVIILSVSIIVVVRINMQRKKIVAELASALMDVKTLSGLLPICSSCKKIRDDSGYWSQIEQYLEEHSDAEFTHSLCPDCAKRLYPDIFSGEDKK